MDRIDLHVEVPSVKFRELASERSGETSGTIRERVMSARAVQEARFRHLPGQFTNAHLGPKEIRTCCSIDERGAHLLGTAIESLGLSGRAYDRILKVSRTIADLAGCDAIQAEHVSEAIQYRTLDRRPAGYA